MILLRLQLQLALRLFAFFPEEKKPRNPLLVGEKDPLGGTADAGADGGTLRGEGERSGGRSASSVGASPSSWRHGILVENGERGVYKYNCTRRQCPVHAAENNNSQISAVNTSCMTLSPVPPYCGVVSNGHTRPMWTNRLRFSTSANRDCVSCAMCWSSERSRSNASSVREEGMVGGASSACNVFAAVSGTFSVARRKRGAREMGDVMVTILPSPPHTGGGGR